MLNLQFSITISSTREKIWRTMLGEATYREWTSAFSDGSHFIGDWSPGSRMQFLAPGSADQPSGIIATVLENRYLERVRLEYLGIIHQGVVDESSQAAKAWHGGLETYTFKDVWDATQVTVDLEIPDTHRDTFEEGWPRALRKLKAISEKQ